MDAEASPFSSLSPQPAATADVESRLALAVDLGQIGVWRHDLHTDLVLLNQQAWAVLGLPPSDEGLTAEALRLLIHPEDQAAMLASAQQALRSDQPIDTEVRYRRSDGSWRQVLTRRTVQRDHLGQAVAFLGVAMDVTERRQAEQALHSAAERVALVTRSAGLGVWEVNLHSGQACWDEQMWRLRGLVPQPGALSAAERLALVHPDDRARVQAQMQAASDSPGTTEFEFRVIWPDGQQRWLASRWYTLCDARGQPCRRIGVNWDVTDARHAADLRQAREVAQRESAAKSRFMARMSHELRTPLNAVLGFTQLLLADETTADPPARLRHQRLQHVRAASQHLLSLINDVLDLASLDSGELRVGREPVPLAPLLQSTLPMLEPLRSRHGVTIDLALPEPAPAVLADATRLRQVLLNLLSNAIKYNVPQGQVQLQVQTLPATGAHPDRVLLRVTDTGCGIDPLQMPHLFEPFNRLGAEQGEIEGTGIGLTIARSLVGRMGGVLRVRSEPGHGTAFEVELPRAAGPADPLDPAQFEMPSQGPAQPIPATLAEPGTEAEAHADGLKPAPGVPRCVLYIEDNPVNAMIIVELLSRRSDLQLHVAVDGRSGVAQAQALRPDLILLDMQLPDFNGLEVMRRLQALPQTAGIPCVALSANAMPDDIQRTLDAGAVAYWTKPLDFRAFTAALEQLLGLVPPAGGSPA